MELVRSHEVFGLLADFTAFGRQELGADGSRQNIAQDSSSRLLFSQVSAT